MAEDVGVVSQELRLLAEQVRRQPGLAMEMDVSMLVEAVAVRWREHSDMLQASEEVPVAAWIVRRKVEGLIRPEPEVEEAVPLDPELKPAWVSDAVEHLGALQALASHRWIRPVADRFRAAPAPVKDPSPWKLTWSYPRLRPKTTPAPRVVERESDPLDRHMERLWGSLPRFDRLRLQDMLEGQDRRDWVGHFLAVVHLWHARRVEAEQSGPFRDLWLRRREEEVEA